MVFTDLALEDVGNTCEEEDKMEEVGIVDLMRTTSTHIVQILSILLQVQFHFEMETEFDGDPTNTAVFWA